MGCPSAAERAVIEGSPPSGALAPPATACFTYKRTSVPAAPVFPHGQGVARVPSPKQNGVPGGPPCTLKTPLPEVLDCPSGFVTVIVRGPTGALAATLTVSVTWVGLLKAMFVTETPLPPTLTWMRL